MEILLLIDFGDVHSISDIAMRHLRCRVFVRVLIFVRSNLHKLSIGFSKPPRWSTPLPTHRLCPLTLPMRTWPNAVKFFSILTPRATTKLRSVRSAMYFEPSDKTPLRRKSTNFASIGRIKVSCFKSLFIGKFNISRYTHQL